MDTTSTFTTKFVAWWGAILSTTVFLWDIYKYRHAGPKLWFRVQTGMALVPSDDKRTFISSEVVNYGDRPTTLTNLTLDYFEKPLSWAWLRDLVRRERAESVSASTL
jgi:hypothetical protein